MTVRTCVLGVAGLLLLLFGHLPASAERRVALVVGNGAYEMAQMSLANPPKDARLVAAALQQLGFEVETLLDAGKEAMEDGLARLARRSRDADVTLFYFAGHGVQDLGKNYLMPVDASLNSESDLRRRFVRLDDVTADLSSAKGARILVLDACRDNIAIDALRAAVPQTRSTGVSRGLAPVPKVSGMLVAFATQPDRVAVDGTGAHSPFAQAIAARLLEPGIELRTALTRVRSDVARATGNMQVPEVSDSLLGELYFRPAPPLGAAEASAPAPDLAAETAFWSAVERIGTREAYRAYAERFGGSGLYAALAAERITALDRAAEGSQVAALAPGSDAARPRNATDPTLAARDVAECDRLAASPSDERRPPTAPGVVFAKLDGKAAVPPCRAAVAGRPDDARLLFQLGRSLDAAGDYGAAKSAYERAAALGHPAADNNLATLHRDGQGVKQDGAEAIRLFEKAYRAGHVAAALNIGLMFESGTAVPRDYGQARIWFERAAEGGDDSGMLNLGLLYEYGRGVKRDYAEARRWYDASAALGNETAMYNMGVLHEYGRGVRQSYAEARRWYEKAAEKGESDAINNLGVLYDHGRGVRADKQRACALFRQSAALGNNNAQRNVRVVCAGRRS